MIKAYFNAGQKYKIVVTWTDFPRRMSCATALRADRGPPRIDRSGDTWSSCIKTSVSCFMRCSIRLLSRLTQQTVSNVLTKIHLTPIKIHPSTAAMHYDDVAFYRIVAYVVQLLLFSYCYLVYVVLLLLFCIHFCQTSNKGNTTPKKSV